MANTTFQLRRSSVAGKAPTLSTLSTGELALNITDRKLYSSDGSAIFEVAANLSSLYIGNSVSYISANSTNIVANDGLVIEQTDASTFLILKNNGHEYKIYPSGPMELGGDLIGGSYGANKLQLTGYTSILEGGLSGVQINSSDDRVHYKTWTFGADGLLTLPGGISANGSNGSAGQVLKSSGSGNVYWATVSGGGSVDPDAQYTWTNTQTFSNTITFSSTINGTTNAANYIGSLPAANVVSNSQLSGNLAHYTNTANLPTVINNNTANDVYYVNGVTAVNVVSNSQLSANLANYTNTASFYLDTLVDVNSAGPTGGQVLTWNSTTNLWTPQVVPSTTSGVTPGYYGSFYDNQANQTISSTTSAYLVRVANTFEQNGVTVVNNTDITFAYSGTYEIIYSIQFINPANQQDDINVWFYKNGNNNVVDSDSTFTINSKSSGGRDGKIVATTPFIATVVAGDYFRLAWAATNTQIYIATVPAGTTPTTPIVPGVILTVKGVANLTAVPPGSNAEILFNDSGSSGASPGLTFNKTTNNVTVGNSLFVTKTVNASALTVGSKFIANSTYVYSNGMYFSPLSGAPSNTSSGSVFYDLNNHVLNVYNDTSTPMELGLQKFVRVYNSTGSTITKGTAVYIDGASSNRPTIAKAISNSTITLAKAVGVVFDDIAATSEGFVLTGGLLQNVDTRNYTAGQEIYISAVTAGALSNTDPSYPNYTAPIGYALNSALVGQIYISIENPSVNLPNTSIYFSNGTGPIVSNNFQYDYTNNILKVGNTTTNATIGYVSTGGTTTFMSLSATDDASLDSAITNYSTTANASSDFAAYDSHGPSSMNFIDMGISGSAYAQSFWTIGGASDGYLYTGNSALTVGTAGAFPLKFFTGDTLAGNERMRITPTGNVGIGNTTPVSKLSVGGDSYFGGNVTITGNLIITGTTVSVNTTTLDVKDKNITVAKGAASGIDADGAGLTVDTAGVGWYYHNTSNTWQSNVGITPSANLTFDLGTTTLKWSNVYANNIVAANLYGTILTASQPYITANNASNLGGEAAASYQLNSTLSANVAKLAANAATYLNGKTESNLNVNSALTANDSAYLGGTIASSYQKIGANVGYTNASFLFTGNTTTSPTITLANTGSFSIGNNSTTQTTSLILIANSTGNVQITPGTTSILATGSVNALSYSAGPNVGFTTTSFLFTGNTTTSPTITLANTGAFTIGNNSTTQTSATITVANSTGNVQITPGTTSIIATGSINALSYSAGANVGYTNASFLFTGNTTTSPTITLANTGSFSIGNNSTTQTSATITVANSTGNVQITPGTTSIIATGSINALSHTTGPNVGFTTISFLFTGNTTTSPTITLANTGAFTIGNNSTTQTTSVIAVANSLSNVTITPISISVGTGIIANTSVLNTNTNLSLTVNDKQLRFATLNASACSYFVQQSDDNFVFYTTNTNYQSRAVFSIYANSITSNLNFAVRANFDGGLRIPSGQTLLDSTGSQGTVGQVLTSNGVGNVYWSTFTPTIPSYVVNTSGNFTVAGNLNFTGANVYFSSSAYVGDNVDLTTTSLLIGNATVNSVTNSSSFVIVGNTTTLATATLSSSGLAVGNGSTTETSAVITVSNSTGNVQITPGTTSILATGSINAASYTVGSNFIANTTQVTIASGVKLSANGTIGSSGQVLTSNGTSPYWAAASGGSGSSTGSNIFLSNYFGGF